MTIPPPEVPQAEILAAGDHAWLVRFGERFDLALNRSATAYARKLRQEPIDGVTEIMPTIASVLVRFDPRAADADEVRDRLQTCLDGLDAASQASSSRIWRIPVLYGGEAGPDLPAVAQAMGRTESELIEAHAAARQQVLMLGFAPGFVYAGLLDETWDLPRKNKVAPEVQPGSVILAVRQTAITATRVPTGWHVIGRTPCLNFEPDREPPVLIESGDTLQFEAIDAGGFEALRARAANGETILESVEPG